MSTDLNAILSMGKRSRRGCVLCGKPTEAYISVRIHELDENKTYGKRNVSRGKSFCATHAAEVWAQALILLNAEAKE